MGLRVCQRVYTEAVYDVMLTETVSHGFMGTEENLFRFVVRLVATVSLMLSCAILPSPSLVTTACWTTSSRP